MSILSIQKKINEISEYFKKKVIVGDYELQEVSKEKIYRIIIDKKYKLSIYDVEEIIYIVNNLPDFAIDLDITREQSKEAHKKFVPKYELFKKTVLKNQKKAELEKLQKELNEL